MALTADDRLDGCNALVLLLDGLDGGQQQTPLQGLLKQSMIQSSS